VKEMNVKYVLEDQLGKHVTITKVTDEKISGLVEQVSDDYLLLVVNGIIEQINIQEIRYVLPLPDKH
jgi:hypothetical protein